MPKMLGILGGMGPLASAEFVKTIYEYNLTAREQDMPACMLYSDPTIPDRTEAIQQGSEAQVIAYLERGLLHLSQSDVSRIVIACITAHYFLPRLRPDLRSNVISLIDIVIDDVLKTCQPHLLFCTNGTRQAGIFQQSPRWREVERYVLLPSEADQQRIHRLLYHVKQGDVGDARLDDVEQLLANYQARGLIAGCTEMHLLTKRLAARTTGQPQYQIADPLLTIARTWRQLLETPEQAHALGST